MSKYPDEDYCKNILNEENLTKEKIKQYIEIFEGLIKTSDLEIYALEKIKQYMKDAKQNLEKELRKQTQNIIYLKLGNRKLDPTSNYVFNEITNDGNTVYELDLNSLPETLYKFRNNKYIVTLNVINNHKKQRVTYEYNCETKNVIVISIANK